MLNNTINHALFKMNDLGIVVTAGIGLFLATLDTGIMNVALPTLGTLFHVSVNEITWSVTLYLLALGSTIILFGRLSDRFGRIRIYSIGLSVFAIASFLCGCSISGTEMIGFRALQGVGAGMLQATSTAIITTLVPVERRGDALGTLSALIGLGPVLGPSLGGFLLTFVGWRWLFWINIPICLIGIIGSSKLWSENKVQSKLMPLDLVGNVFLSFVVFSLLFGFSIPSFITEPIWLFLFIVSLIGFILWEKKVSHPILPVLLFKNGRFTIPLLAVGILGLATSTTFIIPPYFLEQVLKFTPWKVGLVNLASPLGLVIISKFSGRLIGKWGTFHLMAFGLSLMLISLLTLSTIQSNWNVSILTCMLLLYGVGAGIFVPPNLSVIMDSVGQETQGTIGALQRMVQNIGIAIGASGTASIIEAHIKMGVLEQVSAFHEAWLFVALAVLMSLIGILFLQIGVTSRNGKNRTLR